MVTTTTGWFDNEKTIYLTGNHAGMIIKYNSLGDVEWVKTVDGPSNEQYKTESLSAVCESKDGGYLVGGSFKSSYLEFEDGKKIINRGSCNAMLIKYSEFGDVEWAKSIGNENSDEITAVESLDDGSYIIAGVFTSAKIDLDDGTSLINTSSKNWMKTAYEKDTFIVKCTADGDLKFVNQIGGSWEEYVNSIEKTENGGYMISGNFNSTTARFGNKSIDRDGKINSSGNYSWTSSDYNGFLAEYDSNDELLWCKKIGNEYSEYIRKMEKCADGGYILSGSFTGNLLKLGNNIKLTNSDLSKSQGMVIKLDSKGECEWAKAVQGNKDSYFTAATEVNSGEIVAVGNFLADSLKIDNKMIKKMNGTTYETESMILKISDQVSVPEMRELMVENARKEFKITTEVQKIDGVKGGIISGENNECYEKVKYGDSTIKNIIMQPDENYEIIGITINDEDYPVENLLGGSYTLPKLNNVTEDKHVVVKYALSTNKITINKVDRNTKAKLVGAEFSIDQVDTRESPENAIGELVDNGDVVNRIDTSNEIEGGLGELTNNGTYYFVMNADGTYTPTNSRTYQVANGGQDGVDNSVANSYIPIDLTGLEGKYQIMINYTYYSESNYDFGYATITATTVAPEYSSTNGRFVYVSGMDNNVTSISDSLIGGNIYYLHLGYRKDLSSYSGTDQICFNSVKLYKCADIQYNFTNNDGKIESTNVGVSDSTCNSYIPIDLTAGTGKYKLTVNAKVSSVSREGIGYATVTQNSNRPSYDNTEGRFIYVSGNVKDKDYSITLQGGYVYYLHLGYYKNSIGKGVDDKFTVNSIKLELDSSNLYHTTVITNSFGQAITQIPFGKYTITEIKAPEGYTVEKNSITIEFKDSDDMDHQITVEDDLKSEVLVHHYIKGTTTKVARDEKLEGILGEKYTTVPKTNLTGYGLEIDETGKYILPENASGEYSDGKIEVVYYYVKKPAAVIVHHYYEGTKTKVVLKNGTEADTEFKYGEEGEAYITVPLTAELQDGYTVINTPENATGVFSKEEIEVTYYYAKKKVPLNIEKVDDEGNVVSGAVFGVYSKYENIMGMGKITNVGSEYQNPDIESGSIDFDKNLMTAEEFFKAIDVDSPDNEYSSFREKNGEFESTYNYDDDGNLLNSLGVIELDLTGFSDKYTLAVEIETNGGYAQMQLETYDNYESIGNLYNKYTTQTFYENIVGGDVYYFTVDYKYDDVTKNYCKIKSIKLYNVISGNYGFMQNEYGEYVSNNANMYGTVAASYMLLDLSDKTGVFELNIESTLDGSDEAYINLRDEDGSYIKNILHIEGRNSGYEEESLNNNTDSEYMLYNKNTEFLEGGQIYILEFVYNKLHIAPSSLNPDISNSISTYDLPLIDDENEGYSDQFVINKILLETHTNLVDKTDNAGNITFLVEPGEYEIVESSVPDGYDVPENTKQRIIVGEDGATITVVNRKHKGTVTVHHYIEGTTIPIPLKNETVAQDEVLRGDEGEEYLTKEIDDDESIYTVSEVPENASGKYIDGNIEVTYYYRLKDTSVITHYYEEGTINKISEDKVINGRINDEYATEIADDIASKYELVATPANATGTMTEDDIEVIYYFRKKATQVIVKHYEEGTTNKLSQDITIDGRIDDPYATVAATDIPIKYELATTPANANGIMAEDTIEVIYYYRVKDAVLNIRYLEKNTNIELAQPEQQHGKVDEEYITGAKTIDGYTLVEHSGNERGKFEVDPLTVTYYYLYNTRATVQYIDKITGQILEQSTTEGLEGDTFITESKSFDNYILVEEPAQKTVKMTKDEQVLRYYYIHVSGGVIEKHIDVISGEVLDNKTYAGNEGDPYDIKSKTFINYDLVEDRLPTNAQGTMTVKPIEVIYYYIYKTKVTAEYIDRATGEKLTEDEIQTGHEGDTYITERKTFDDYKLVEVPANADGEMTKKDIIVTYNYVHTSGGVIVNHIDINTGKQLKDETKQEGYEGDPYETHEENIPGYTLVKEKYPVNAQGTMTREGTRVTYYYVKNTEVNIKYIDKETGEEITEKTSIPGTEGKEYTTEAKEIPGYDLVEEPENKNGTMTSEPIDVIYYYRRPAKVVTKYIDQETNEEIATEEKQEGHQNDEYTTEAKDIKYYKLVATPDNATGTMKVTVTKDENGQDIVEDTTYVTYYYRKLIFNLNIDKKVLSVTVNGEESIINGDLGKVEVPRKEINTAQVEIKYIIKVTNDSELSGSANILEDIPTGMTMNPDKNSGWDVKETTATRQTKELQLGESEEYEVVLDWANGENNIGMKENTAAIISTENEAGFTEKDTTDNEDKADIIVAIGTGGHTYVLIAGGMLLILISLACGVYAIKKRK